MSMEEALYKFHHPEIFNEKFWYFQISAQNIYCGYSLEPARRGGSNEYQQSIFLSRVRRVPTIYVLSRNKKNNVYPCKPQFYYIKVGLNGVKLYRHVFVMRFHQICVKTNGLLRFCISNSLYHHCIFSFVLQHKNWSQLHHFFSFFFIVLLLTWTAWYDIVRVSFTVKHTCFFLSINRFY